MASPSKGSARGETAVSEPTAKASKGWGFGFGRSNPRKDKTETGFHSLKGELAAQSAAWDLDSAREAAAREVHTTLSGPESLGKLTKLREEYERQLAGTEVQLSLVAGRQAEEAKAILKLVDRCKQGMDEVEGMRSGLSAKLEEAVTAVPNYSLLRKVFVTRRNLGKTLVDLDSIVAVPTEMKRIEELLDMDDGGNLDAKDHTLPDVHKSLMQLERRQEAAMYQVRASQEERESLERQFGKLERFYDRVANRMWQIIRNCTVEAQARPAVLVKALQMIERQEKADEMTLKASSAGGEGSVTIRGWYAEALITIKEYVTNKFEMFVGTLATSAPVDIQLLIAEHEKLVDELTLVKDLVEPCFPPRYHIFDLFASTYHALTVEMVQRIMSEHALSLSTKDIIDIVNWLRDYHSQLDGLEADVSPVLTDDIDRLLQGYNYQTETMMRNWSSRILEEDLKMQPESGQDGRLYTIAPIDLFKMIAQQFEVVDVLGLEKSTFTLAMTVQQVLDDYRACVQEVLQNQWKTLELTHISAQINNSTRMMDGCQQLLEDLEGKLGPEMMDDIELQALTDGFATVSRHGATAICNIIFQDLEGLIGKLFSSKWLDGDQERVCMSIIATIKDYANECQGYLHETYYRKLLMEALERLVRLYIAQLLKATSSHNFDMSDGIRSDQAIIEAGFTEAGLPARMLQSRVNPLSCIANLCGIAIVTDAGGKHADMEKFATSVCAWLSDTLGQYPDMPTDAVFRILRQRSDLDAKSRNAVLHRCNQTAEAVAARAAESGGKTSDFFKEVYKELGVPRKPYVATESVFSALANLTTTQMMRKSTGHVRQKSSERVLPDQGDGEEGREAAAAARRKRREEKGSNAVDIMYRLQM